MHQHATEPEIAAAAGQLQRLRDALRQVLFGQEALIDNVITGLLARGHLLLEGLPGLGKTELVKGLAQALRLDAKRIQFTPDLLPGDITGNPILQEIDGQRRFVFEPGPLFANLVLADEINRASPNTQSGLLEAMQERGVTVMVQTHPLPDPFFVLATQNPIQLEGTYPLAEAQLDRFLFKLQVDFPEPSELVEILERTTSGTLPAVERVADGAILRQMSDLARTVPPEAAVLDYAVRLVVASHPTHEQAPPLVRRYARYGASPRGAQALVLAGKIA